MSTTQDENSVKNVLTTLCGTLAFAMAVVAGVAGYYALTEHGLSDVLFAGLLAIGAMVVGLILAFIACCLSGRQVWMGYLALFLHGAGLLIVASRFFG